MNTTPRTGLSPLLQRYSDALASMPEGTILFIRLGDFYEVLFEPAEVAAKVLGITLTKRMEHPMAGVPWHSIDRALASLRAAGHVATILGEESR